MALIQNVKKMLESLGRNNKPIYAVVAIATANGIFKPLTSLTDKKEAPETKKYAALREFLTEVVAVPTYIACAKIAEFGAQKAYKNNPQKLAMAKTNLGFLGVCTAAVFVIPAVCSIIVKPFTDMIYKRGKSSSAPARLEENLPDKNIQSTTFSANYYKYNMTTFATHNGRLKI